MAISNKFGVIDEIQERQSNTETSVRIINDNMKHLNDNVNAYYHIQKEYQKTSMIVMFAIGMLLIISMITSILVIVNSINKINENMNSIIALIDETQKSTSEMSIEIAELRDEIGELKSTYAEIPSEEIMEEPTTIAPIEEVPTTTVVYNTTDFTHKSGYSAEQFNEIIKTAFEAMGKKDTALIGIGDGLYQAEQEYDVNGLYMLGIASLESGWGTSTLATKNNNVFGLVGMSFDSYYEGSVSMGKIMRNSYFDKGFDTWDKFQSKYCPSGGENWIYNIKWCANKYITAANELYPQP